MVGMQNPVAVSFAILVAATVSASASHAGPQGSGVALQQDCQAQGAEPAARCNTTIAQTLEVLNALSALGMPGAAACIPARTTASELRTAFLDWAARNPPELKRNDQDALMAGLSKTYPCR